jgi:hypothetical protein
VSDGQHQSNIRDARAGQTPNRPDLLASVILGRRSDVSTLLRLLRRCASDHFEDRAADIPRTHEDRHRSRPNFIHMRSRWTARDSLASGAERRITFR